MKEVKVFTLITALSILSLLLISGVSAADIFIGQINNQYNGGDILTVEITITSQQDTSGSLEVSLICGGMENQYYKDYLVLTPGDEKKVTPSILLIKDTIGNPSESCKVKAKFKDAYKLSDYFKISNIVVASISATNGTNYVPNQKIEIRAVATRENGDRVENGLMELKVLEGDSANLNDLMTVGGIITAGEGSVTFSMPKNTGAKEYLIQARIYEKDSNGDITNEGTATTTIIIDQVPTTMEISTGSPEIALGAAVPISSTIYDQTKKEIVDQGTIVTIKDPNNKIIEQISQQTGQVYNLQTEKSSIPGAWKVISVSDKLTAQKSFNIPQNQEVTFYLEGNNLIITNVGNVAYNKTILVKIGNTTENIPVNLGIGQSTKYTLKAENGEYHIRVSDGKSELDQEGILLTGKAISVNEYSQFGFVNSIIPWIFIAMILGAAGFLIFKKNFINKVDNSYHEVKKTGTIPKITPALFNQVESAELSLSVQGEKQNSSLICLKIKNFQEIEEGKSNAKETIDKLIGHAKDEKTVLYKDRNHLFFLLVPALTRTFQNEKPAVAISKKMEGLLNHHNKMFNQKIEYGIAVNSGDIVSKKEGKVLKFSSFGNTITLSKKIAGLAENGILLSQMVHDKVSSQIKTERITKEGLDMYKITEMKWENPDHKKFIDHFMERNTKPTSANYSSHNSSSNHSANSHSQHSTGSHSNSETKKYSN